jgi:prepilin-type N-terminal cleavage/methylation domain-containing protein
MFSDRKRLSSIAYQGFSLLELMLSLLVMGIVAAIALPSWNRLEPSYRLNSSARQLQSELHRIKMRAAAENVSFQLAYVEGAAEYTIQNAPNPPVNKPLPQGVMIAKAGTISFSPRGTAAGNRVRLQIADGLCRQVVVSPTGRVRICRPDDCLGDC